MKQRNGEKEREKWIGLRKEIEKGETMEIIGEEERGERERKRKYLIATDFG